MNAFVSRIASGCRMISKSEPLIRKETAPTASIMIPRLSGSPKIGASATDCPASLHFQTSFPRLLMIGNWSLSSPWARAAMRSRSITE